MEESPLDTAQAIQNITAALTREQTYVLMMRPNPDAPQTLSRDEVRIHHYTCLLELERSGRLFAAGPFADLNEKPTVSGMITIRAVSRTEASDIGAQEPYTKAGLRIMESWFGRSEQAG
jgi:uncharacterized protein YciI